MERIFANLYQVTGTDRRGTSYTCFLKRKEGNLLVCHQAPLAAEDIDEIEQMGGQEW